MACGFVSLAFHFIQDRSSGTCTKLRGYHSSSSSTIESMTACGALLVRQLRKIPTSARSLRGRARISSLRPRCATAAHACLATRRGAADSANFPPPGCRAAPPCSRKRRRATGRPYPATRGDSAAHLPLPTFTSCRPFQTLDDWRWPHLRKLIRALGHASPGTLRRLLFPVQPGAEIDGIDGRNVCRARAKMAVVEPHARPAAPAALAVRPRAGRLHVQPPALPQAVLARRAKGDQPEAPATRAHLSRPASGAPQHWTFFRRGLDVRLPQDHAHECGLFCRD